MPQVKSDNSTPEGGSLRLNTLRHSTAHVLAQAVRRLYGDQVKYTIGPALTDDFQYGFYYDFDLPDPLREEDLPAIEKEMTRIIAENLPIERQEVSIAQAKDTFQKLDQNYKFELIDDIVRDSGADSVTLYRQGDFLDLCRGPHLPATGKIPSFKLLATAGAYWRGDSKNKMLTRIYGVAFFSKKDLKAHLAKLEEAKKRDHRVLGKELDLFSIHEQIGPGLVHWHPAGGMIRHLIERFWLDEHLRRGYQVVYSPHIASEDIYKISGHLDKYADMMYSPMEIDGRPYRVKPMNCPGHIKMFQTRRRSYRELPIRYCELGTVYRYEPSGTLHGMLRVRGFTQDDSHIFCTPEQLAGEIEDVLDLADLMMKSFGYRYSIWLSTRPEKYIGTEQEWDEATASLREALENRGVDYEVDPGGGVFYAPKIDIKIRDSLGRQWQGPTIQVDLNLPKRFNITYIGADNAEHPVIMVHRTVLGSMERFVGGLIEHCGGAFPTWLAPVQAQVLTISEKFADYGCKVAEKIRSAGLRVELNDASDKIGHKIRDGRLRRIPFLLVVGEREAEAGTVNCRRRSDQKQQTLTVDEFIGMIRSEVEEKK